jgi:hypothetical protein
LKHLFRPALSMTLPLVCVLLLIASPGVCQSGLDFDRFFTGETLRFDYFHTGTHGEEQIALDRVRLEGEWSGRRTQLFDTTNLGLFMFVVIDAATHQTIYSAGFSSIFGEWQSTGEARAGTWRAFHESQRFPEPRQSVQLVLKRRALDGTFREIHSHLFDPASRFVDRSPIQQSGEVWNVFRSGPAAEKVDLLILGDGYGPGEMDSYRNDARAVAEALFSFPPFSRRRDDFNVWAIDVAATESGVTKPREGTWRGSPIGLSYNIFDSERYMLTFENRKMREIAAAAPYDFLILIANSDKYGGGGIFNLYSTAAAKSEQMPYLIVHEFGHAFAGLGDEYYTSQVAYEDFLPAGVEPWEPNVTALVGGGDQLKWRGMMEEAIPVPTPWNQTAFDETSLSYQKQRSELRASGASEKRMDEYFAEVKKTTGALLAEEPYRDQVGAFEGAGYQAKGLYRPSVDCIMFTRNPDHFCRVCSAAIERIIDLFSASSGDSSGRP